MNNNSKNINLWGGESSEFLHTSGLQEQYDNLKHFFSGLSVIAGEQINEFDIQAITSQIEQFILVNNEETKGSMLPQTANTIKEAVQNNRGVLVVNDTKEGVEILGFAQLTPITTNNGESPELLAFEFGSWITNPQYRELGLGRLTHDLTLLQYQKAIEGFPRRLDQPPVYALVMATETYTPHSYYFYTEKLGLNPMAPDGTVYDPRVVGIENNAEALREVHSNGNTENDGSDLTFGDNLFDITQYLFNLLE